MLYISLPENELFWINHLVCLNDFVHLIDTPNNVSCVLVFILTSLRNKINVAAE